MAPEIAKKGRDSIITFDPVEPTVPPEILPEPLPKTEQPISKLDVVPPLVPTTPTTALVLPPSPPTPLPSGPIAGTGTTLSVPVDPPARAPVFVGPQVNEKYTRDLQPPYPGRQQREGIEGKVTVKVLIGTDGRVKAVQQVSADDPAFFAATEQQALRRWRFKPATRDGVPVESWREMTVRFQIQS